MNSFNNLKAMLDFQVQQKTLNADIECEQAKKMAKAAKAKADTVNRVIEGLVMFGSDTDSDIAEVKTAAVASLKKILEGI